MPSTAKGLRRQVLILTPLPEAARAEVTAPNEAALPAAVTPGSAAITMTPVPRSPGKPGGPASEPSSSRHMKRWPVSIPGTAIGEGVAGR